MKTNKKITPTVFELKFTGGEINPDKISSHELAEIIMSFEDSIVSLIKRDNKDFKEENLSISLIDVETGSLKLKFKPKILELALPAFITVATCIKENSFSTLPYKTVTSLEKISTFCKEKKCSVEFREDTTVDTPNATIYTDQAITVPKDLFIVGETIVYGRVVRVGGIEPKVSVSIAKGDTLYCDVSETIAKQLGKGLYNEIGIRGKAKWLKEDYSIVELKIESFFHLERVSLTQAFNECRELIGKYWKDVTNVEQEISKIRGYSVDT